MSLVMNGKKYFLNFGLEKLKAISVIDFFLKNISHYLGAALLNLQNPQGVI